MSQMMSQTRWMVALSAAWLGWCGSGSAAPILLADYKATDFNQAGRTWVDSSGNHNNATQRVYLASDVGTLVAGATPNGSSVVSFTGIGWLEMTTGINASTQGGLTFFAFVRPSAATAGVIVGGANGNPGWRIWNGKEQLLRQNQALFGTGTATIPTNSFANMNVAFDANGTGTFRYNGVADGTTTGTGFNAPVLYLGASANYAPEFFKGLVAEIRIYKGVLTDVERQAVEAEFHLAYVYKPPRGTIVTIR